MALVQPVPRIYSRPAQQKSDRAIAPPRKALAESQASQAAWTASFIIFAIILVLYVAGHARMTGVNYQRVRMIQQMQSLQHKEQIIHSELVKATTKQALEQWALAHGMERAGDSAIVLSGERQ